ncbi:stalk domain-containing protein [Paenibacillus sp. GCM10027627]|uniref:stalk domain-containing protein n=1 Tax=unclassified Paenibacillus TaxID=185978 RepID=UPI003644D247
MNPIERPLLSRAASGATKLLVASTIAFSTVAVALPAVSPKVEAATVQISNAEGAINQAKSLKLLPEGATITSTTKRPNYWEIYYKTDKKDKEGRDRHFGEIWLNPADGSVLKFYERLDLYEYSGTGVQPPFDESKQKVSFGQASEIAKKFIGDQVWKLDTEWKQNLYPVSDYVTRTDEKSVHWVRFDRSHNGIRYVGNHFKVLVDRVTGEVRSYEAFWSKTEFVSATNLMTASAAAKKIVSSVKPFLQWSDQGNAGDPAKKLVYALHPYYHMDAASGVFPKRENVETPPFTDKVKPQWNAELAQKKLLALYDLELSYMPDEKHVLRPHYTLRIKPGVPLFYTGQHPYLDANTGKWIDFENKPVTKPLPPAGDWLIDTIAPVGNVGYKAAVVWNNEPLKLANEPIIQNGFTLVPFRELLEKLGAQIKWDAAKRKVTASKNGTTIELTIDSKTVKINGKTQSLDAPARISNGRTYIPARLVLQTFGAKVGWNADSRLVIVTTDDKLPALTAGDIKQLRYKSHLNAWEAKLK